MISTSPETDLLVCVARRSLNDRFVARIQTLVERGLDWNRLFNEATNNGMLPLLYRHLNAVCPESVPPEALERLRSEALTNTRLCLHLFSELKRILTLFEQNGLIAASFKGPVLSLAVYGDMALRPAGDLDILVPPNEFRSARDLLISAGYQMVSPLTESQQDALLQSNCELLFYADDGRLVDLHWGLSPRTFPFALDAQAVLRRREEFINQGVSISTFSIEDTVLYLCFHGSKHYWSRLEWISSLAEFIRSNAAIDWPTVISRAKTLHAGRILALGLLIAQDLEDVDLPELTFLSSKDIEFMRKCAGEFEARLFAGGTKWPTQMEMFSYNLKIMDRKRDAMVGLLRSAMVPTMSDWQVVNLPRPLHPLYYLLRPVRLIWKRRSAA
ncbi:MAG: nucleotidyltransferase domain-containing protein [Pyrinomonadaceae bacterium]